MKYSNSGKVCVIQLMGMSLGGVGRLAMGVLHYGEGIVLALSLPPNVKLPAVIQNTGSSEIQSFQILKSAPEITPERDKVPVNYSSDPLEGSLARL